MVVAEAVGHAFDDLDGVVDAFDDVGPQRPAGVREDAVQVGREAAGGERVEVYAPGIAVATEDFKWLQSRSVRRTTRSRWWPDKGYAVQLEGFLADVRGGRQPAIDVVDGARATLSCLRLLDAAREGTWTAFDLAAILADDSDVSPS